MDRLAGALLFLSTLTLVGQIPQLSVESVGPDGIRLRATTTSDQPLTFEASFSLQDSSWYRVGSSVPSQGVAQFHHAPQPRPDSIYYRARVGTDPEPTRVVPELDPLHSVAGLLLPDQGLQLRLLTPEGVEFEFLADTNLVTEPLPVRMTLITNFVALPGSSGWQAAVAFQPDGARFRGSASLRISFPNPVSTADLLAYSFQGDGSGFHFLPFNGTTQSVVMAIDGFSGKGVGLYPEDPPLSPSTHRESADGIRAAEDRAARRDRKIRRDEAQGRLSATEAREREKASHLQKLDEIFRDAVKPFLDAGRTDCNLAKAVITVNLERLTQDWAKETGRPATESPFTETLRSYVAETRCRCARRLINRCEQEAGVSGSALLQDLDQLLADSARINGRQDAQGCHLGSDEEIRARLQSGPCFGAWEGTVTISRELKREGKRTTDGGAIERTWNNLRKEMYVGRVTGILQQRTSTSGGRRGQLWELATAGPYAASRKVLETITTTLRDIVIRETRSSTEAKAPSATGTVHLIFVDGEFDSLGVDARPTASADERLEYTTVDDITHECLPSWPSNQECPPDRADVSNFNFGLFMGFSPDRNSFPPPKVTLNQRTLSLTWERTDIDGDPSFTSALPAEYITTKVVLNLVRK
jgi:hypothetical protein